MALTDTKLSFDSILFPSLNKVNFPKFVFISIFVQLVPNFPIVFCFNFNSYKSEFVLPAKFWIKRKSNSVFDGLYKAYKEFMYVQKESKLIAYLKLKY